MPDIDDHNLELIRTLAYGLAPANATQYHVQRLRWGQGTMQIMRKMNPLFLPGLTWKQRVSYISALIVYFDAVQRLVFYLAPIVFFLTTPWSCSSPSPRSMRP